MIGLGIFIILALFIIANVVIAYFVGKGCIEWGFVAMDAPDFWEHFPKEDDNEVYVAEAGIQTDVSTGFPRESEEVQGIMAAYVEARRMGTRVENKELSRNSRMSAYADGSYPGSVGVWWAVRKKETD